MNRQNQVRRTIKKLREEVAEARAAVAIKSDLEAKVRGLQEQVVALTTDVEALKVQRDRAAREAREAKVALEAANGRAWQAGVDADAARDLLAITKAELADAKERAAAVAKELAEADVSSVRKLRRRLQEAHDENVKLAQQARDIQAAADNRTRIEKVAAAITKMHGGVS